MRRCNASLLMMIYILLARLILYDYLQSVGFGVAAVRQEFSHAHMSITPPYLQCPAHAVDEANYPYHITSAPQ